MNKKKLPPAQWPTTHQDYWPLEKIIPYPNNPRTHPPEQITLLAQLMQKYGVDQPIVVDEKGIILKGHGRRMAAIEAGFTTYPVVIHRGLKEADKRAIRIADNQVALLSGWSNELLREEMTYLSSDGYDMPLLGFSESQLVGYMAEAPRGKDPEVAPEPPAKPVSKLGDLWLLGKHRILCGDSTKAKDVARALDSRKPNLMVTDPPYGVEYDASWRNEVGVALDGKLKRINTGQVRRANKTRSTGKVENDDRADWREAWMLFGGDTAYVWHGAVRSVEQALALEAAGFQMRCQIIWDKMRIVVGRGDYHWQHEPCWYAVRKGKPGHWTGSRTESSVWAIPKQQANETGHSTQKPIECMRRPIQNNSEPGEYIYEPFAGSGTTIIAAEIMARYCLAIELSPAYVDVCVRRWQTFTGKRAMLAGDGRTFAKVEEARKKPRRQASGAHTGALAESPGVGPG